MYAEVQQTDLDQWKLSFPEALGVAKHNLPRDGRCFKLRKRVWHYEGIDAFNSSAILMTEVIERLRKKGDAVAFAPNWRTLLITGADDEEGLAELAREATRQFYRPNRLSGVALRLRQGKWEDYLPAPGSRTFYLFKRLQVTSFVDACWYRSEALEAQPGKPVLRPFLLWDNPRISSIRYAAEWRQEEPTFLPRAEMIALFIPLDEHNTKWVAMAKWEHVERIVGHLLERQPGYPELYMVTGFPTPEEIKRIGFRT